MAADRNPHFTVLIPTKDRAEYLRHTLRTCAAQDYDNLEIVVSDDGSTDTTKEVVLEAAHKDPRIRYASPGGTRSVGMLENFEFALEQASPGFVMVLGGDDGIMPHGIQGMREMLVETGLELLGWAAPIYSYPTVRGLETGQLIIYQPGKNKIVDSREYMARQARNLSYVTDKETPMIYVKGVVSTQLVERVRMRSRNGRFYSCATPDGYSGIVLAGEVKQFGYSGESFTIYGSSPSSQGAAYLANDVKAISRSESFYKDVIDYPMNEELGSQPYSPLITLMTADYLLTVKNLPGWPGMVPDIDYKSLLVKSLAELSLGVYSAERIARELNILHGVAERHQLGAFFRQEVKAAKRFAQRKPFEGSGFSSDRLFIDCTQYHINDVFDASYVASYLNKIRPTMTLSNLCGLIYKSFKHGLQIHKRGDGFPEESEWLISGSNDLKQEGS